MKLDGDSTMKVIKMKKKKQRLKTLPKNVFEIVAESGQVVERVDPNNAAPAIPKADEHEENKEPPQIFSERTQKRRRREWDAMNHESFDMARGREYEKSLQRLATRGIVQLFNTVRKQQSSSLKTEKKEGSIKKGEFLDMLKTIDSDEVSYKTMKKGQTQVESRTPVRWDVLRDDLMASVQNDDDDDT